MAKWKVTVGLGFNSVTLAGVSDSDVRKLEEAVFKDSGDVSVQTDRGAVRYACSRINSASARRQ